jgi:glycosyltransferase involved in cell wall biosynthesis
VKSIFVPVIIRSIYYLSNNFEIQKQYIAGNSNLIAIRDIKNISEIELPNKSSVKPEIKFENDSPALFKSFTYFVHTPVDALCEAYGQIYVESLAAGIPSVFTLSGVANEFIKNNFNALVVDYKNPDEIYNALVTLTSDVQLADNIKINGYNSVINEFSFDKFIQKTEELYS